MTTMPAGPLIREHRLIEQFIGDLELRLSGTSARKVIEPAYVERTVDFLRNYADRCHHGKEEDILFRDLKAKAMEPEHKALTFQLIEEHEWARGITRRIAGASASLAAGNRDSLPEVRRLLRDLASFYPEHIRKEERMFFRHAMDYLSDGEKSAMLRQFTEFDASLVHERYRDLVRDLEASA